MDIALLEALELPLNGPRRFWLGFVFVDDGRLAARSRALAGEVVRGRGRGLEAHVASDAAAVEAIAGAIVRHHRTDSPVWVDWSRLGQAQQDRDVADRSLAMLNVGRTRLSKALRGGLVIAAPSWAERSLAQGAVDLWSGREFALQLRSDERLTLAAIEAAADLGSEPIEPQLWRRIAPIAVMRALREDGVGVARLRAETLAADASSLEAARCEVVAAGLALEAGDRDEAATRALAVIEDEVVEDVFAAAIEIAAAGSSDRAKAARLWRRAVDTLVENQGEDRPDTLVAMSHLAATLRLQGDLRGARELLEQVSDTRRWVLGDEHPDTLSSINDLAETLWTQGELHLARMLHERALDARRRMLGGQHPDTLKSRDNLAGTLRALGDLHGARILHEQALEAYRRVRGDDHPDTLSATNNLAATLRALGDLHEARKLHELTLAARHRVLGDEHPDTLRSMNNLAATLHDEGNLAGSHALQEQALVARRRVLGDEHPDTLRSMNNLAVTLREQGDARTARTLHEQALDGYRRMLGEDHPDTLRSMNRLAVTLWVLGDLYGAQTLQEHALAARRRVLGPEHRSTLSSMSTLAVTLRALGDLHGAQAMQEQALEVRCRVLGGEHPHTLMSTNDLAETLRAQGDVARARSTSGFWTSASACLAVSIQTRCGRWITWRGRCARRTICQTPGRCRRRCSRRDCACSATSTPTRSPRWTPSRRRCCARASRTPRAIYRNGRSPNVGSPRANTGYSTKRHCGRVAPQSSGATSRTGCEKDQAWPSGSLASKRRAP